MQKDADAYRTISEVAEAIDIPQHVLRFWETKFPQVRPLKRGGGRRYYRRGDVDLLRAIRRLLYDEGYTIRGVQRLLKTQGAAAVAGPVSVPSALSQDAPASEAPPAPETFDDLSLASLADELQREITACRHLLAGVAPKATEPA